MTKCPVRMYSKLVVLSLHGDPLESENPLLDDPLPDGAIVSKSTHEHE